MLFLDKPKEAMTVNENEFDVHSEILDNTGSVENSEDSDLTDETQSKYTENRIEL